ncbi:MAG: AAA family ATPase, partial [Lachnospiraceae bacterium]|nr:AAA family ATPase [Lachnospiraceae bacterium]
MRILTCHITNFGKHHNVKFSLNDGFNIMNAENGWGKSTFAAFIRAIFYGLDQKKRSDKYDSKDLRKNYAPWQGGKFGGSVTFEYKGKEYHLERYFGKNLSEDSCTVIDMQTMKVTEEFGDRVGEAIFGIDAEGFERTIYIPHNSMDISSNDSINARLMGLIEDENDMSSFERAISTLENARRNLKKTGGRGKIDINRSRIDEDRIKLREKQNLLAEKHKLEMELESVANVKSESESTMESSDNELQRLNEEHRRRLGHNIPLIAGIVLVLAGIASFMVAQTKIVGPDSIAVSPLTWGVLAAVCIFVGLIFILFKIMMSGRYRGAVKVNTERASAARKSFADAVASEARMNLRLEEIARELTEADELKHNIETMEENQENDIEKLELIQRTEEFLRSAKSELSLQYMERMRTNFQKYVSEIMSGEEVALDSDFNIT